MESKPQQEHAWLQQLVGAWTFESVADMGPGQEPCSSSGTEQVRALGGLWIVGESQGEMPGGGDAHMQVTLGYDPGQKAFVGTWVGSMMSHLWVYRGTLDADRKELVLEAEGPSFQGDGTLAMYRDVITLIGPDERTLRSRVRQDDGSWKEFMKATYRRTA